MGRGSSTNKPESGELDLGWIPFEACPEMSIVDVNIDSWGPNSIERNTSISDQIWVEGSLEFVNNGSSANDISVSMFLVKSDMSTDVPGSAAIQEHLVATVTTGQNGSFNLTGLPSQVIQPRDLVRLFY